MVAWLKAFQIASKIIICSILFYIIGAILIVAGLINLNSLLYSRLSPTSIFEYIPPSISIILGFIILAFGTLASFLKFNAELIRDELNKTQIKSANYNQSSLPSRNNTQNTNNQPSNFQARKYLGAIAYLVTGLIISVTGYYYYTTVGRTNNFYISIGVWTWMIVGAIIATYGAYLVAKKSRVNPES